MQLPTSLCERLVAIVYPTEIPIEPWNSTAGLETIELETVFPIS